MAQWYVKELSTLTQVSVQTLHHYDRIDLLTPSVRLANGYRLYSEKDLLKLQQIVALKFFGFELSQIKILLCENVDMINHFANQSQCLEQKAKALFEASQVLKNITSDCRRDKSIPWETIIKLIEVYRMTQQLEKTWAGKVFNTEQLKEYAEFEQTLHTRFSENERLTLEKEWKDIVNQVDINLDKDPTSTFGIALGKKFMAWVNTYYGKQHIDLRNTIWEKGFREGQIEGDNAPSPATFEWLDKAINAYYKDRVIKLLSQIETKPHHIILKEWEELVYDICGDNQTAKNELFNLIASDTAYSQSIKDWVKQYFQSI